MLDWETGKPNARYWVLNLLKDNSRPVDKLVQIAGVSSFPPSQPYVYSSAAIGNDGKRRVLLVKKRDRSFRVSLAGTSGGKMDYVDQTTVSAPASVSLTGDPFILNAFSVGIVTLPSCCGD